MVTVVHYAPWYVVVRWRRCRNWASIVSVIFRWIIQLFNASTRLLLDFTYWGSRSYRVRWCRKRMRWKKSVTFVCRMIPHWLLSTVICRIRCRKRPILMARSASMGAVLPSIFLTAHLSRVRVALHRMCSCHSIVPIRRFRMSVRMA